MRRLGLLVLAALFILSACAKKEEVIRGESGGRLVIGTTDLPAVLSPLAPSIFGSNELLDLLFIHMHRVDPKSGKMKPELAASWEFSDDLTSITYYLRKDVHWSDGTPVTADDILYTFQQMKDPRTNYPNSASLRFIKDVEVLGPYTIRFNFAKVYADILTDSDIMAVPRHSYEELGSDFGRNPVGNGPYKIKEWVPDSIIVFTFNPDYYRGRPLIDEIVVLKYANAAAMMNDLSADKIDLALKVTPRMAKDIGGREALRIDSRPGNSYIYIGWNLKNEFLKDRDVRRTLEMAINKKKILQDIFANMGMISTGPLPPTSWAFNSSIEPIAYDPVLAQEILRQKGFEDRNRNRFLDRDGRDIVINLITNIENPERVDILNMVASDLRAVGIRVNTSTLDAASFIEAVVKKSFDGFIMGWSVGDKVDPTIYWYSDPARGRLNFVSYRNPAVDSLIDLGVAMLDRKKAKEVWDEFQDLIYEEKPYTFLIVPNNISVYNQRVRGLEAGVGFNNAYAYWIPDAERRIAVASVVTEPSPVMERPTRPAEEVRPPEVVEPERILEAAVKKETTEVAVVPAESLAAVMPPPKPSVITRAQPISQVKPHYPESARTIGATGRVVVRVVVGIDGKVKKATILQSFGNPACEAEALAAAEQWVFKPATKDGAPFEQNVSIPFDFNP